MIIELSCVLLGIFDGSLLLLLSLIGEPFLRKIFRIFYFINNLFKLNRGNRINLIA